MKKINFNPRPPTSSDPTNVDAWVENREIKDAEPTKRLTIVVPLSLHRRIKTACALNNRIMADEIRALLDQRFPASQNTEREPALPVETPS